MSPRSPIRPRAVIGLAWVCSHAGLSVTARSCASTILCGAATYSLRFARPASSIQRGRVSVSNPLRAKSALAGVAVPGRYGRSYGEPGIVISERIGLGLATVAARRGKADALSEAVANTYGVDLPTSSRVIQGSPVGFIGYGPGQWLAVAASLANEALALELSATKLAGLASISDQSGGRT